MKYFIAFIVVWFFHINACADDAVAIRAITTNIPLNIVDKAKGSELEAEVDKLTHLINSKNFAEAEVLAISIRKAYEAKFDLKLKQLSFQSRSDFNEYAKTNNEPMEWIDWGYKESIQTLAFIKSENKDFSSALKLLNEVQAIAPISAGTAIEKGYILNNLGKFYEALLTYQNAYDISIKYKSQRVFLAAALRGKGFALGELRQFDKAEEAYRGSLLIEPANKTALNELEYIQSQRMSK